MSGTRAVEETEGVSGLLDEENGGAVRAAKSGKEDEARER